MQTEPSRGSRRARVILALVCGLAVLVAGLIVWRAPEAAAWAWRLRAGTPAMADFRPVLDASLHWADDYYAVADLGHGAFAIGEPKYGQCNFSYLIVGSQRALWFDTGPGVRNIEPVARALLPRPMPLVALPSHLHFDHTGNLHRFAAVALP